MRKIEIRTCPVGHKTEYTYYPPNPNEGITYSIYCPGCTKEYKPEDGKKEIKEVRLAIIL